MNNLIKDIVYSSIINLFQNQPDIFENTYQTNFTEWNLNYHLSNEIAKYIFWLNVDLDVTKRNYQNRRPDIIFHKRKTNTLNFLVVELKKSRNDNQSDINKIIEEWMRKPLSYRYGVYINIWKGNKYQAILLKDGERFEINEFCNYISVPNINNQLLNEYKKLTDEIISKNNENDSSKIIQLIDSMVLKTYEKMIL
ncbi:MULTISPECIES: hypothetical protein [Bacillus cereus group]|uniref:hypothetical protein n=1 Tax=Bacillus cereus group TaxID=86661 RepID=UPI0008FE82AC|nr:MULTISPECIES: hypothetical protein [Bacillus cereus group]MDX5838459.1 hypothetical protein [Bacillus cereus group sp. BfR-BA-01700]OJE47492.1 hypothetical protein BAQ44_26145 [Bacillus mobilis]HDR7241622.1 hypothetical protein [Bacillus mobilis]